MSWTVTTFYRFFEVGDPAQLADRVRQRMGELAAVGLVIVAHEGINGTVARQGDLDELRQAIESLVPGPIRFKDSTCKNAPFKKTVVDVRREVVSLRRPVSVKEGSGALTPAEWDAMLKSQRPKVLIDVRNSYEARVGKFRGAMDPGMRKFSEWPDFVKTLDADRSTPVLIYCTGGIRCEKAAIALKEAGFHEVYQLQDGILGYLEQRPNGGAFEGECFVFDERVALDTTLRPTKLFTLCAVCGSPMKRDEVCAACRA